jgi:flagellar basal-body rod modification protein FlgD
MIASNFTTFLQLLTTQLKNQNPLDTNQFTQQLTQLANNQALWSITASKPATASITIKDANGQTAYTGTFPVNPGSQNFVWDGHGNNGTLWPDGTYTLTAVATDASGQTTALSTQIEARVDSVDLSQNPPLLSINGQNYTMDQLKKIVAPPVIPPSSGPGTWNN